MNTIAEEVTGYRVVKQGEMAKDKLRAIEKERSEQMSAILEEQ